MRHEIMLDYDGREYIKTVDYNPIYDGERFFLVDGLDICGATEIEGLADKYNLLEPNKRYSLNKMLEMLDEIGFSIEEFYSIYDI